MSVFGDLDIPEYNPAQTRDLDKTTWDWLWRSPGGADVEEGEAGTAYYDESGQYRAGEWYVPEGALERREEWLSSIPSWAESEYKIKAESLEELARVDLASKELELDVIQDKTADTIENVKLKF